MINIPDNATDDKEENDNSSKPELQTYLSDPEIHDSPADEEKMKPEEFTIDLPDVSDIPGQEHVHVPQLNQFADVTIASDDEEGVGILDDEPEEEDADLVMGTGADVDTTERRALRTASEDIISEDNTSLRQAALDNRDDEGDQLNEGSSATKISGTDLDVPGAEDDNLNEAIGEEDEENNDYSLGGDDFDEPGSEQF